ncbi:DNA repair protein RAD5A isoform X2 [Carica papaya]|uniref:DNA repair protein RAD5A isoform X2 n=1 Tax=Carica papaya TaxID=3649 RepID=UPI000B8CB59A|nr:DNA repair protein RAD5A isoform X2 [Carica papaya]
MGTKVSDELVSTVRSVVGSDYSDMDIIRALHLAKHDATAAINIIFDTPNFKSVEITSRNLSSSARPADTRRKRIEQENKTSTISDDQTVTCSVSNVEDTLTANVDKDSGLHSISEDWWFVGSSEVAGLSTCKGRKIKAGDEVVFTFPLRSGLSSGSTPRKGFGRGREAAAACSEIMRFATKNSGEIGRMPNEWARCLLPLVRDKKVRIEGHCTSAPDMLGIMDTILLSTSVSINSSMFRKHKQTSLKAASSSTEESVFHPLPNLFRLLGLTPFKKAEFTPADLYTRKRPLDSEDGSALPASLFPASKFKNQSQNGNEVENEECISDADLDNIVGLRDSSELEEMDSPSSLQCELRPYQKQALNWMIQLEKRQGMDEAATTLHPCWDAYRLADKRGLVVYLNSFSGDAATEFPSTLQMARGGMLADAMGLGKTIMTIALLLAHSDKGGLPSNQCMTQPSCESCEVSGLSGESPNLPKKATNFSGFDNFVKQKKTLKNGVNLIICPMTLLGQWKAEIETHVHPGSLSLYIHYGQSRLKDAKILAQSDVVITTYGVLASEFSGENAEDNGGLFSVHWFRVVLDEAHTIKSSKSLISMAAAALVADRRWCLTGTPIQNKLEDIYSLLRFLRVEPWGSWACRGDTQEYSDLNKMAKRFLKGNHNALEGEAGDVPSRAYVQEVLEELRKGDQGECPICLEAFEDAVLTPCAHRLCRECLLASWRNLTSGLCPVCRKAISRQDLITAPTSSRFQIDVEKNWVESSKITLLLQELEHLRPSGSKTILFSQWTAFLDLLEIPLSRSSIPFVRLDGTLNQQQRERVIKQFSEDTNILVFLMSLKAGGVGINLTAASNAFVLDPWWNPAVEVQAVMRIHRIGQMKRVTIKRFIVKGTVEERMEAVQARKQQMIAGALTDQEVRTARIEELKMLFT